MAGAIRPDAGQEAENMRKWIAALAALALLAGVLTPGISFTEDRSTVLLARAIYALGKNEPYETKLALGTVVMNRLENVWFEDTLPGVLNEQHQFPIGSRYDSDSLAAAHAVLSGRRTLSREALYYQALDASAPRAGAPLAVVGGYAFYA